MRETVEAVIGRGINERASATAAVHGELMVATGRGWNSGRSWGGRSTIVVQWQAKFKILHR
jgi:hypothetical protein